jgi:outer membrane protein assembly factor BamB
MRAVLVPAAVFVELLSGLGQFTAAAAFKVSAGGPVTANAWTQPGYDSSHQGFNPAETVVSKSNVTHLVRKWHYGADGTYSDPVTDGHYVVLTTRSNGSCSGIHVLKAGSGQQAWKHSLKAFKCTDPVITGGAVYLLANNPWRLYAWKISDGARLWSKPLPQARFSGLTEAGGRLFYNAASGWVKAVSPVTGKQVWAYNTKATLVDASPAVYGHVVYVNSASGKVFAIGSDQGHLNWSRTLHVTSTLVDSTLAVADGKLFLSSGPSALFALDVTKKGAVVWSIRGMGFNSDLAVAYHKVYLTSPAQGPHGQGPSVFALDDRNGKQVWQFTTGYVGAKPSVANGIVYTSNNGVGAASTFFALDATSGKKLWSVQGAGSYPSYPAIAGGRVYLSNYAYGLK